MKYAHLRLPTLAPALVVLSTLAAAGCSSDKQALLAPSDALISMTPAAPLVTVNGNVEVTVEVKQSNGGYDRRRHGGVPQCEPRPIRQPARFGRRTARPRCSTTRAPTRGSWSFLRSRTPPRGSTVLPTASGAVVRISLTASQGAVPFGGGQVDLKATVFGEGNQRVVGAPVVFQTSTGSFTPFAPVLTNDNGEATARLSTSEAATARARVHTQESDAVNIGVEAPISMRVVATPSPSKVGEPVRVTVTPSDPSEQAR